MNHTETHIMLYHKITEVNNERNDNYLPELRQIL